MKKKTLLYAIIITLLIIMGVSYVIAGFMVGIVEGLVAIGLMSLVYSVVLCYIIIRDLRGQSFSGESNTCYPDANTYAAVSLENIQVLILKVILGKFGRSKFLL